jgi:uncharacterized protein (TIGR03435 family)
MARIPLVLVVVICAPILTAQQPAPRFEVASIKRSESRTPSMAPAPRAVPGGRFRADIATVETLVSFAYGVRTDFIVAAPDWARQDLFEINAKASYDAPANQIKLMLRSLLEDRFKLSTHMEGREMQVLALVRARPDEPLGSNLTPIDECSPAAVNELRRKSPEKYPPPMGVGMISGCSSMGLGALAILLSTGRDIPILDATGLTDNFYYTIRSQFSPVAAVFGIANTDPNLPALSTALEEQLGLKLQSRRAPVEVLMIDSVEMPTPN